MHLLIHCLPKLVISNLVNSHNCGTSRLLRCERPDIARRYDYKGVLWTQGYFAGSCGSAPILNIRQYIRQQQTPSESKNGALYSRPGGQRFAV